MKSLTKFIHESYYGADGETERRAGADHSFQNSKFKNSAALVAAVKKYDLKKSVLSKIQDDARIKEGSRTKSNLGREINLDYSDTNDFGRVKKSSLSKINESLVNGRNILPTQYNADNFGDKITDIQQLSNGSEYVILDLDMDTWQAGYEYTGKKGTIHVFKSTEQFDDSDFEFTDSELKDAVKGGEIYEMI